MEFYINVKERSTGYGNRMKRFGFKIVLLGDPGVGKTSLVLRYVNNSFSEQYTKTIGADFLIKSLDLFKTHFRLIIWDIGGEKHWTAVRERYMQGADGCILVLDTAQKQDGNEYINQWLKEIQDFRGERIPTIIVGNKIDLKPAFNIHEFADHVKSLGYNFVRASAKTGDSVNSFFTQLTADIYNQKLIKLQEMQKQGLYPT